MPAAPGMTDTSDDMKNMPGMDHPKAPPSAPGPAKAAKGERLYCCPMHPDQTSHNPNDLCKICGMKLNKPVQSK